MLRISVAAPLPARIVSLGGASSVCWVVLGAGTEPGRGWHSAAEEAVEAAP